MIIAAILISSVFLVLAAIDVIAAGVSGVDVIIVGLPFIDGCIAVIGGAVVVLSLLLV